MSYEEWIGKRITRDDIISQRLIDSLRATFAPYNSDADMPEGVFWCLCPDIEPADALGSDGHPQLGKYLPDLGFERRMWAGGNIIFHHDLTPNIPITRQSEITKITPKDGYSGKMVFVTVTHHYKQADKLAIEEDQILVYRQAVSQNPKPLLRQDWQQADALADRWSLCPDTTMLFRYSALTFNGHRIHYDKDFSISHEGHEGLIIHGPIQATLLMALAQSQKGQRLRRFSYRNTAALICGDDIEVLITQAKIKEKNHTARGAICDHKGHITMTAEMELAI